MEFHCYICEASFGNVDGLCNHYKYVYFFTASDIYVCIEQNCFREYFAADSFKKHLVRKHTTHDEQSVHIDEDEEIIINVQVEGNPVQNCNIPFDTRNPEQKLETIQEIMPCDNEITPFELNKKIYKSILCFTANMYGCSTLNRRHVQTIIEMLQNLWGHNFLKPLKDKIFLMLHNTNQTKENLDELNSMFSIYENLFSGLESDFSRLKALEDSGCFIKPISYIIGSENKFQNINNIPVPTPVNCYGQYVPMPDMLKKFFELPNVLDSTLDNMEKLNNSEVFTNFVQGSLWKQITSMDHFVNKTVLPLLIYFDDVEPENDTSAHRGSHKVGMLYHSIPCIPTQFTSVLENLFLSTVFLSNYHTFGNTRVFAPVISELLHLEKNGLRIRTSSRTEKLIYFSMCLLLCDNLGIHTCLGAAQGFSANYPCRFCKAPKEVIKNQVTVDESISQNSDNYAVDVMRNNVSETGIKESCVWDCLQSFSFVHNQSVDFMHDFLESGIVNSDLCGILKAFIFDLNYFDLDTLNDRMLGFHYGPVEIGNKPAAITAENIRNDKLRFSASEMLTFVRFGLMIGDLIEEEMCNAPFGVDNDSLFES